MFKTILARFVELAQKLLIIYFMNLFILTSFGKITKIFGLHFLVNLLNFPCRMLFIVNYGLLYIRSNGNVIINVIMLLTPNNSAVFCS